MRPLRLVVGPAEEGCVDEVAAGHDPLGEVLLPRRLLSEEDRDERAAVIHDARDALLLEALDDRARLLLGRRRIGSNRDAINELRAVLRQLAGERIDGRFARLLLVVRVDQTERARLLLDDGGSGPARFLSNQALADVLRGVDERLVFVELDAPPIRRAVEIELCRLCRSGDRDDAPGGELFD